MKKNRTTRAEVFEILGSTDPAVVLAGRLGLNEPTVFGILSGDKAKVFYREYVELHGEPKPRPPRGKIPDWLYFEQTPLNLPWGRATKPTTVPVECTI